MLIRRSAAILGLSGILLCGAYAQTGLKTRISSPVTYVTPGTVYVGGGTKAGLEIGDSLTVAHSSTVVGQILITAVSSNSSAAQVIKANPPIVVGDSAFIVKDIQHILEQIAQVSSPVMSGEQRKVEVTDNNVTGRVAIQYAGAGVFPKKMDYSQPSTLLQLGITRLLGTGMVLTAYGRTSYDLSTQYSLYGTGSRLSTRMYELSITYDNIQDPIGFGFGRILSRYLGGLGLFDGVQFFVRTGQITAGVAGGTIPDPVHSALDLTHQKGIAFANYAWGGDVFSQSNLTMAYGQQLFHGKMDRDFFYTQSYIRPTEALSFYESSEFDVHDIQDGTRVSRFHLTSGFATLTYAPLQWLSVNTGVDASRPIWYFETYKNQADSLFSKQVQEGIRGGVSIRLPMRILLMSNASYRPTPGQIGRTITTNARMGNIAESGLDGGVQFTTTSGVYTKGTDFAVDFSRWISQLVSFSTRVDRYAYTITSTDQRLYTTTLSLSTNLMISRWVYVLANYDQVWDTLRNTERIYFEFGVRF